MILPDCIFFCYGYKYRPPDHRIVLGTHIHLPVRNIVGSEACVRERMVASFTVNFNRDFITGL
jgi:hypothetical protein